MNKNKERDFENATRSLIKQIDSMNLERTERLQVKNFILLFRDSFKQESVKHATFSPVLGTGYKQFLCDSCGFCKASSVSFVSFMNKPEHWQLRYIDENWTYGPHYYIVHIPTGHVLDLTFDQYQFETSKIPYNMGRPALITRDARDTAVRFTHALGMDVMKILNSQLPKSN